MSPLLTLSILGLGISLGIIAVLVFGFWRRWILNHGKPPWHSTKDAVAWGMHAEMAKLQIIGVSRHHIAESGLVCPVCGAIAAVRGDYRDVRRMRINGTENEIIVCKGERQVESSHDVECGTVLAASPDTEHGDHLDDDGNVDSDGDNDPPEFYRFVRIGQEQAIREEFGEDAWIKKGPHGADEMFVNQPVAGTIAPKSNKHEVLVGEDLQKELLRLAAEEHEKAAADATTKRTAVSAKEDDTVIVPTLPPKP